MKFAKAVPVHFWWSVPRSWGLSEGFGSCNTSRRGFFVRSRRFGFGGAPPKEGEGRGRRLPTSHARARIALKIVFGSFLSINIHCMIQEEGVLNLLLFFHQNNKNAFFSGFFGKESWFDDKDFWLLSILLPGKPLCMELQEGGQLEEVNWSWLTQQHMAGMVFGQQGQGPPGLWSIRKSLQEWVEGSFSFVGFSTSTLPWSHVCFSVVHRIWPQQTFKTETMERANKKQSPLITTPQVKWETGSILPWNHSSIWTDKPRSWCLVSILLERPQSFSIWNLANKSTLNLLLALTSNKSITKTLNLQSGM